MKTRRGKGKQGQQRVALTSLAQKLSLHKSGQDWKLNPSVQVKVNLENTQLKSQAFSNQPRKNDRSGTAPSRTNKKVCTDTNFPPVENFPSENREAVVFDYEYSCIICHEYIRRFTEHIRESHQHQEHEYLEVEIEDESAGGSIENDQMVGADADERENSESVAEILIDDFDNPDPDTPNSNSCIPLGGENSVSIPESERSVNSDLNEHSADENNLGQPEVKEENEFQANSDSDSDSDYEPDYSHKNKIHVEDNSRKLESHKKALLCKICDMKFRRQSNLTIHLKIHRMRNENSADDYQVKAKSCHPCPKCSRICNSIPGLRAHYHHAHKKFLNQDLITETDIDVTERNHSCHLCDKSYTTHKSLWEHCRIKHQVLPKIFRVCKRCDLKFNDRDDLKAHMQAVHSQIQENGSICNTCGKVCPNNYSLSIHKRVHTGDKPFMCEMCSKRFPTMASLKRHYEVHVEENGVKGIRPFVCDKCDARFTRKIHMTQHSILKHTVARPYVCEECGMGFKILPHLKDHRKIHLRN